MMIGRVIKGLWKNTEETSDQAKNPILKTSYYKASKGKVWDEIIAAISNKKQYRVIHTSKEMGEISIEKREGIRIELITVSIIALSPMKIAVDIFSATKGVGGDLGANYFNIRDLKELFNGRLQEYILRID